MNWRTRLTSVTYSDPEGKFSSRQELHPPTTQAELSQAAKRLKTRLPDSLRGLLLETNGVMRMMSIDGNEWFEEFWTVWPVEKIVEENEWLREQYGDRGVSRFVFFAGAGADGVHFGFLCRDEFQPDAPVFAWYPDETEDKLMAERLDLFLEGWCSGRLSV